MYWGTAELDTRIRSRERKFEAKSIDSNALLGLAHDVGLGCEPIFLPNPDPCFRFVLRQDQIGQDAGNLQIF
jgi:hypothetical protein